MLDPLTYKLPPHMPINNKSRSSSEPFDWARETREIAKDQKRTMRGSNAYKMMDMTDDLLDRRIKATIAFGNEAVKRYKDYPALVDSQQDSAAYNWIILNLSAGNTYNMIESKYYLLCGAAIWILDRITEIPGWRQKLYPLLPQDISLLEGLNLPDLWDAKYEYELIMSVVYILYHRNDDIAPVESIGRRLTNVFTNSFLAKDKEPANAPCKAAYRELLSLIPSSAIEDAIKTYVSLFWEWTDRYFSCASLISKEIKAKQDERIQIIEKYNKKRDEVLRLQEKLKKENLQKRSSPKGSSYNALLMKPFPAAPSINASLGLESNPAGGTIDLNRVLSSQQRLDDPNRRFAIKVVEMLDFTKRTLVVEDEVDKLKMHLANFRTDMVFQGCLDNDLCKEKYGAEIAEQMKPLVISDPYGMCFALLSLIESGSDFPWLYGASVGLMQEVAVCLPWSVGYDGFADDDDLDDLDNLDDLDDLDGLDDLDDFDDYDDLDDAEDSDLPDSEGSASHTPAPVTLSAISDWYERRFYPHEDSMLPHNLSLAQIVYKLTGCLMPRNLHMYDSLQAVIREYGVAENDVPHLLCLLTVLACARGQICADNLDEQMMQLLDDEFLPEALSSPADMPQNTLTQEETTERLKRLQEENKRLQAMLHESGSSIRKLNRELADVHKTAALDHRELADLREIIFNQSMADAADGPEAVAEEAAFPYEVKQDTVIFGGHESWLKTMRALLKGDVRYIDKDLVFDPLIIRHADIIWIQTNSLSHKQYYRIIDEARRYQIPVRYFTHASAKKGAIELMNADKTAEL